MDNLKRFDDLLEDLGEESSNFEKVIKKVQELKNNQLEDEIYTPEEFDASDTLGHQDLLEIQDQDTEDPEIPMEEADSGEIPDFGNMDDIEDASEYEDEPAPSAYSDYSSPSDNFSSSDFSGDAFSSGNSSYQPDSEDLMVDEIFRNIDTPEYREKKARGLFAPKFSDEDYEEEPEEEHSDLETEDLEHLFGAPKELAELNQNFDSVQDELADLDDIDGLLSEAKELSGEEESDELEPQEEEPLLSDESFEPEEAQDQEDLDLAPQDFSLEALDTETPQEQEFSDLSFDGEEESSLPEEEGMEEINLEMEDPSELEKTDDIHETAQEIPELDSFDDQQEEPLSLDMEETGEQEPLSLDMEDDLGHLQDFIGQDDKNTSKNDFDFDFTIDDKDKKSSQTEPELNLDNEASSGDFPEEWSEANSLQDEDSAIPDLQDEEIPLEKDDLSPVLMSEDIIEDLPEDHQEEALDQNEDFDSWEKDLEEIQSEENQKPVQEPSKPLKIQDAMPFDEEPAFIQEKVKPSEKITPARQEKSREEKKSEKLLSDAEVMKIQQNLNKLPINLALHLRDLLLKPQTPSQTKEAVTQELLKDYPNSFRLEALSGFEGKNEPEAKTSFMPILKILAVLVIVAFIISLGYFFIIKDYFDNKNLLEAGLEDIKKGQFELAKDKFNRADPNLEWYNRYAEKFLEKNDYRDAEEKLLGVRDQALNVIKPGAVDLNSDDTRTRLNIADLYLKQKKFEKVLENDSDPAKQYDDSLYVLHNKNPEQFEYVDRIGRVYMLWADQTRIIPQKREILSKGYQIYFKFYNTYPESYEALSRITHLSIDLDDNVDQKLEFINQKNLMTKMHHETLAKLGLYFTDKERFNIVYQMISILNDQKTQEPLAYYMMGNYYYRADNMELAELSLIKGIHFNGVFNDKQEQIDTKDKKLESKMLNMLGEVYLSLAEEYNGPTQFNQEKQDKFVKLSLEHFQRAKKNDPDNALSYFHYGNMHYKFYGDYKKSSEDFLTAYSMLKENQDVIPSELYYNLSNALYQMGKADTGRSAEFTEKSLEFLSELRTGSAFRVRPAVEYLLGMIYYDMGYLEESKEKFSNVLEYYQEEVAGFLRSPNPMSVRQNKIFYFLSVTYNNLGCVYNSLSMKDPSAGYEELSRLNFYKSIEMGTRYRNDNILALSRLNLNDALLRDNLRYAENFRIGKRPTYIYPFTPKYLGEYE